MFPPGHRSCRKGLFYIFLGNGACRHLTQKVTDGHTKAGGNAICGFSVKALLASAFQIRQDTAAHVQLSTELAGGYVVLGAKR